MSPRSLSNSVIRQVRLLDAHDEVGDAAGALLDEGVHVISRGLLYVSTVHEDTDLDRTREAVGKAAAATAAVLAEPTTMRDTEAMDATGARR